MTNLSIRLRLTIWYAVALLVGLGLFGLGMWLALQNRLVAGVDDRLSQRVQGLRSAGKGVKGNDQEHLRRELTEFASEIPDGTLIELRDPSDNVIVPFPSQQVFSENLPLGTQTVQRDGKPFRVLTDRLKFGSQQYGVIVVRSLDEVAAITRDFRTLLFLMIPVVLVVACLGGYWLSVRALRPVDEITSVAKSISVRNLSQRLTVPRTGDELQRMAETWNEVLERLDTSVQRIRQFTADASHELRTPVAVIRATAELALRREREPNEYRKSFRAIESEAERMTALTESLLQMARADSNEFNMAAAPADIAEVVRGVVEQNGPLASKKGIALKVEANGQAAVVKVDVPAVRRLLLILIDNALKHTPTGGAVTVSVGKRQGSVVVAVADTGEGISPEALPHLFERFYRCDPARGEGSGFGLGLSIAQAIAQAHQTCITVESAPGVGARFSVALKS